MPEVFALVRERGAELRDWYVLLPPRCVI